MKVKIMINYKQYTYYRDNNENLDYPIGWYYFDETWDMSGPFKTEIEAEKALEEYTKLLG